MFSLDLFRRVAQPASNCFISPYSISAALAMVQAGAVGSTRDDLGRVLGVRDPLATFSTLGRELARRSEPSPRELRRLPREPQDPDELGCRLAIANALWHQRGYPIAPAFVSALEAQLGADVRAARRRSVRRRRAHPRRASPRADPRRAEPPARQPRAAEVPHRVELHAPRCARRARPRDENGTEAAAVTMEVVLGAAARPRQIIPFVADRPFLFAIRDAPTNTILFLGKLVDPRR